MIRPRGIVLSLVCVTVLAGVQAAPGGSRLLIKTQQSQTIDVPEDVKRGIELYQQGDDKGAIELLRRAVKVHKNDVAAWHFLGLAYERQGKSKDARKAHEQAVKAGEMMLDWMLTALAAPKDAGDSEQLKSALTLAAESAAKCLTLTSKPLKSKVEGWNSRAAALRDYVEMLLNGAQGNALSKIYKPSEVTTKARIMGRRAEPQYSEEARKNLVAGTVVLRAVIAPDGRLRGIRVISGLPHDLTQNSIDAARQLKFAPAMFNGQPVPQHIQLEYNFNFMQ